MKSATSPETGESTGSGLDGEGPLSYGRIFVFWIPLAIMWLMMAVEQPAVTAVIARLDEAEINLASFGVMFSIAILIESPVLQMLSAATARARNRADYRQLLRFMTYLAAGLTAIHLLIGATPIYGFILRTLMGVPQRIVDHSRTPFLIMAPFAAAVGYRRLWQGALIRYGRTVAVPVTMISRLVVAGVVLFLGYLYRPFSGAALAAIALSIGVCFAAITAWMLFRKLVFDQMPEAPRKNSAVEISELLKFYVPLSLTSIVFLLSRPLITYGMAHAAFPVKSLAVWPVINAFLFLFNSFALSFQEAAIAVLERGEENRAQLSRFSGGLAAALSGMVLLAGLTPISRIWFEHVAGLTPELRQFTTTPVIILSAMPALVTIKSWLRGQYVSSKRTGVLAQAVVVYTVFLLAMLMLGPRIVAWPGVILAAGCLTAGQLTENVYLRVRGPHRQRKAAT
jgi:hypothetical protein